MRIWDIILKMLFLIGIVAVVIMEPSLRQCGNEYLTPIITDWNTNQAIVLVERKVKNVIKIPVNLKR